MIYVISTALILPRLTLFATEHLEESFKQPGCLIGSFFYIEVAAEDTFTTYLSCRISSDQTAFSHEFLQ